MIIKNLTPHKIVVDNGTLVKIYEPDGLVARVDMKTETQGKLDNFDLVSNTIVGHNLPEPQKGVYLLVSAMVKSTLPDRTDLIAPNTNEAKRNEKGHIISVPSFVI